MKLTNIHGNSYIIRGGTNTGVVMLQDQTALLIDPGLSLSRGERLARFLLKEDIKVSHVIVSHEHLDHYEAYTPIRDAFPNCHFACPVETAHFLAQPKEFLTYAYGAKPGKILLGNTKESVFDFTIHQTLEEERVNYGGTDLDILNLKGHSHGLAAVLTPDRVFYLSDSLFDYGILGKFQVPFVFDVQQYLDSLDKIQATDFDYGVIGHSKGAYSKVEINQIAERNRKNMLHYLEEVREMTATPMTREDILARIVEESDMKLDFKEHHYYYSTVGSMLSYLMDRGEMDYVLEAGKLFYRNH